MQNGLAWVKKKARYTVGLVVAEGKIIEAPPLFARYIGRDYLVVRLELERHGLEVRETEDIKLPDWWPAWLPTYCSNHHVLRPGTIGLHWYECECPGATYHGHHRARCRRCDWTLNPPECSVR